MSSRRRFTAALGGAALAPVLRAARAGNRTASIHDRLQALIDAHEIPGAVTVVATRNGIPHLHAQGHAGVAGRMPMRKDTIFGIASMTKPITGAAVMMLQDAGKLSIDDPVSKFIPALPKGVLLRHMMMHTSGMPEATPEESAGAKTLADLVAIYSSKPLGFEPGSQWRYCQSGINSLARVVEIVSGLAFPEFLDQRLLGPLGMKDTTFYPTAGQIARRAEPCMMQDGKLQAASNPMLDPARLLRRDRPPLANGGLFSTARDYARFSQMLLNGGQWQGRRYLSEAAVKQMTSIHTGDLKAGFVPGSGWGLTVGVVREPQGVTAPLSPGTFGHGGAFGTQAWIDPVKGVALILMIQRVGLRNSDASDMRRVFQEAAMAA